MSLSSSSRRSAPSLSATIVRSTISPVGSAMRQTNWAMAYLGRAESARKSARFDSGFCAAPSMSDRPTGSTTDAV